MYREPEFLPWDGRRVPITFVGGYLGAGKTTAINEVLQHADRPIAVVVNDAGAVNIDAALIRGCDGDAIELTNGCVCCTDVNDMGKAFDTIRARPEPPEQVVIELSGVAEPANVVPWSRSAGFYLDGIVVVVAADQFLDPALPNWIRRHIEAQVSVADLLALTKTDLVGPRATADARSRLADLAPDPPVVDVGLGRREPGALGRFLALGGHHHRDPTGVAGPTLFDLHQTHVVPIGGALTRADLENLLAELPGRFPDRRIVRAKGVVDLADDADEQVLVQVVGSRHALTPVFAAERRPATDLVVITVDPA